MSRSVDHDGSHNSLVTIPSVFSTIGSTFSSNARGAYLLNTVALAFSWAATLGLTSLIGGTLFFGTAGLPFVIGSSVGWTMGACFALAQQTQASLQSLLLYPELMRCVSAAWLGLSISITLLEQYPNLSGRVSTAAAWAQWRREALGPTDEDAWHGSILRLLGGDWRKRGQVRSRGGGC